MGLLSRWRRRRSFAADGVQISEEGGVRYLHLDSETVQSGMRIGAPDELVLSYTRSMLSFLLFVPPPLRLVNIGLGGGSLAKWIHCHLRDTQQVVLELNPHIIRVARQQFCLPPDDSQLCVIEGDGARWIWEHPDCADVVLVDGYDGRAQASELATDEFYRDAARSLRRTGVLVVNLWGNDRRFDGYLQRIEAAFDGQICCVPAAQRGNVIAMAFKQRPLATRWDELHARAQALETAYGIEFRQIVGSMRALNPHTTRRLLI